jgi:hypothetical protein
VYVGLGEPSGQQAVGDVDDLGVVVEVRDVALKRRRARWLDDQRRPILAATTPARAL